MGDRLTNPQGTHSLCPPACASEPAHTQTVEEQWAESVRAARDAGDRAALQLLFDEAVATWGHEGASDRWFHLMGEGDGDAQTG